MKQCSDAIFIGLSAGGVDALNEIFRHLAPRLPLAIIVVLHIGAEGQLIPTAFRAPQGFRIKEADEKEKIEPGCIYFAPANYHLLVESDRTFSLSTEGPVNYARPSIDVTFESAAEAFGDGLVGVVLTGANDDGAAGLRRIKERGGLIVVQDPDTAHARSMPLAAIREARPALVLGLRGIAELLTGLAGSISLKQGTE